MSLNVKKRGRKALPFTQKLLQAWTRLTIGEIAKIEEAGNAVPEYLAAAAREKMLRDGLMQQ